MTKKMSCGNCGNDTFRVKADNDEYPTIIEIQCLKCGSTTLYKPDKPQMKKEWGEFSRGVTCFMGEEE